MKPLSKFDTQRIAGGACTLHYEIQASAIYLPFISQYFASLQSNQITADQFLKALNQAGLNPSNIIFKINAKC